MQVKQHGQATLYFRLVEVVGPCVWDWDRNEDSQGLLLLPVNEEKSTSQDAVQLSNTGSVTSTKYRLGRDYKTL